MDFPAFGSKISGYLETVQINIFEQLSFVSIFYPILDHVKKDFQVLSRWIQNHDLGQKALGHYPDQAFYHVCHPSAFLFSGYPSKRV
jgi:hypothetical protein